MGQQKSMLFETTLKSVAIFRDGYGYYVREGTVKLQDGWATTNFLPSAMRGSVYVYALSKGDSIDTLVSTRDNQLDFASAKDIRPKLVDKIGTNLTVTTHKGQKFDGQLSKVLDDMLLLQVGDAFSAVPYAQIESVSFPGYPLKIKVKTSDPNKTVTLGFAYLQEGISWEPTYVLSIVKGKATLALRAGLRNTTEPLKQSEVQFVVGSPIVVNRGIPDMLASMPALLAGGGGGALGGPGANRAGQSVDFIDRDPSENSIVLKRDSSGAPNVTGDGAGELFYYTKKGLSLQTGDIAVVSIFDDPVQVTPTFDWNADGDEVDYVLDVKNTTAQPLTTGSVLVTEEGKPLGQEVIHYTPIGGDAKVKISRGVGVRIDKTEAEVSRGAPIKVGKTDLIPITLKGTLSVANFRPATISISITRSAKGKILSQSDGGSVIQTRVDPSDSNAFNEMKWKVSVEPGKTKTVTYTYETYVAVPAAG